MQRKCVLNAHLSKDYRKMYAEYMTPNQLQDGSTAVMYACQLNHLSIADRLIEVGADLELPLTVSYVNEHGYIVASYLLTMNVFSTLHSVANCQLVSFLRLQKTLLHVFISIYVVLLDKKLN